MTFEIFCKRSKKLAKTSSFRNFYFLKFIFGHFEAFPKYFSFAQTQSIPFFKKAKVLASSLFSAGVCR